MLSRLVIAFLPRSKHLLIAWLQSLSTVILEPKKIKSLTVSPSVCHEVMGPDAVILDFGMLILKPAFSLSSFTFIKRLFSSSSLSAVRVGVICVSEVTDISPQQTKQQTFCSSFQAGFLILAGVEYWRPASFLVILVEGKKEFERIERGFLCQS